MLHATDRAPAQQGAREHYYLNQRGHVVRLGQMWAAEELGPQAADFLHESAGDISGINVTSAEGSTGGNGHAYFRKSPWASSDILMTLAYDLPPVEPHPIARGLCRHLAL